MKFFITKRVLNIIHETKGKETSTLCLQKMFVPVTGACGFWFGYSDGPPMHNHVIFSVDKSKLILGHALAVELQGKTLDLTSFSVSNKQRHKLLIITEEKADIEVTSDPTNELETSERAEDFIP